MGADPAPRHRRRFQGGRHARDQEGARPARPDARELLRRTEHAHAHLIRARRPPALGRRHQYLRDAVFAYEGRDAEGHRAQPGGAARRHHRAAPLLGAGAAQFLAERLEASVINAGDGAHEHPTQALLDTFTIREKLGRIAGLHVVIIGDILFSRVARSNIHAWSKLGARVTLVRPEHARAARVRKNGRRRDPRTTLTPCCQRPTW